MAELVPTDGGEREGEQAGSMLDLLLVIRANIRRIVLVPLIGAAIGFSVAWMMTPIFTGSTTILTPQKSDSAASALLSTLGGLAGAAGAVSGIKNPVDQWIGLLKSRTIADAIIKRFDLRNRYDVEFLFQARRRLAALTDIQSGKDGLIVIAVDDKDPKVAADMAAAYVKELQTLTTTLAVTEAGQRRLFYEEQLKAAKDNLDRASEALQQGGVAASALKTDPGTAFDMVARLKAQIAASEVRIQVLRGYLTDRSAEVRQAAAELESLKQQVAKADTADGDASHIAGGEYVARYRDFKYYETLFQLMAKQYELAKVDEAQEGAVIQVVDPAQVPEWKTKPSRLLFAIGGAGLALVGVLLHIAFREWKMKLLRDPVAAAKFRRLGF